MSDSQANENVYREPSESLPVLEFIRVAYEFVVFIEKLDNEDKPTIFDFFHKIGPLIYVKGLLLPEIEPEDKDLAERFVTEEEWENVFNDLRQRFDMDDIFWFIDPVRDPDYQPVKASLSEHLTDIYQDLKDCILLYQKNNRSARDIAVYELKRLFKERWGARLIRAINAIHTQLYPEKDLDHYEDL
jgi:hypothetical protein